MTATSHSSGGRELPELKLIDHLDVFVPGCIPKAVKITRSEPLTGELVRDASGLWFLAPEESYRGGGMGSIRVHNLSGKARSQYVGKLVKVTGVFEDGKGLSVEAIVLEDKPFED